MSPTTVFVQEKRAFATELKFVVDPATAQRIRAWARERLEPDPNAGGACGDTYRVASIYHDTPEFAIFRREGWLRHSKFRIRRYDGGIVFLERKLKLGGLVAKRRAALSPAQLERYDQLPEPARWFAARTAARRLRPVCRVDYDRTARVALTANGPIRLTLDENLCARPAGAPRFDDALPAVRLTDEVVLELKFRRDLPVRFKELVGEFLLEPRAFSKYRAAVQALGLGPRELDAVTGREPALLS